MKPTYHADGTLHIDAEGRIFPDKRQKALSWVNAWVGGADSYGCDDIKGALTWALQHAPEGVNTDLLAVMADTMFSEVERFRKTLK